MQTLGRVQLECFHYPRRCQKRLGRGGGAWSGVVPAAGLPSRRPWREEKTTEERRLSFRICLPAVSRALRKAAEKITLRGGVMGGRRGIDP